MWPYYDAGALTAHVTGYAKGLREANDQFRKMQEKYEKEFKLRKEVADLKPKKLSNGVNPTIVQLPAYLPYKLYKKLQRESAGSRETHGRFMAMTDILRERLTRDYKEHPKGV